MVALRQGRCSREELRRLAGAEGGPCVSIYLPTHRYGNGVREDRIRTKNLVNEAERIAAERGVGKEVREMLAPLRALDTDTPFWIHQSDGLAALASPGDGVTLWHLPVAVEPIAVVNAHYYVRPLLSALADDLRFFILALSQKSVRLFECDRGGARQVDLSGGPTSLGEAVGYDWEQRSLQYHTGTPAHQPGQRRPAVFHGQGRTGGDLKDEFEQFIRRVEHHVRTLLGDGRTPLLLAAVERVAAEFRRASSYPAIMDEKIEGNPDLLDGRQLHGMAMELIGERHSDAQRGRLEAIGQALSAGLMTTSVREILEAVEHSRVGTLVVRNTEPLWGLPGEGGVGVELHPARRPESEDLLDVAARLALRTGADVLVAEPERMPEGAAVAASLRF